MAPTHQPQLRNMQLLQAQRWKALAASISFSKILALLERHLSDLG